MPSGDTHVIYFKDGILLNSLRLEMMRFGAEDFELLKILEKSAPKVAGKIASKIFRSFYDYTKNVKVFDEVYKELLQNFDY